MNAKKAKQLRKIARQQTVGAPAVKYSNMFPVRIFAKNDVLQVGPSAIWLGQAVLAANCTRAAYHALKRAA